MTEIQQLLQDPNWQLTIDVDPNVGGDGPHIHINGDTNSFRTLAKLLTVMADVVDEPSRTASGFGWHFALSDELPQLTLANASLVAFNCSPMSRDSESA